VIRRTLSVATLALAMAACAGSASPSGSAPAEPEPVTDAARDVAFALTLSVDRAAFRSSEPITVAATWTYLGPKGAERVFHAARPVGFVIEEIGGGRGMGGGMELPCLFTDVVAGQPVAVPFGKAGEVTDDPSAGFDLAWYQDPVLRLPPGSWRIVAYLDVYLGDCGGESHTLEAAVGVVVEP
jgi:hypothetical protein